MRLTGATRTVGEIINLSAGTCTHIFNGMGQRISKLLPALCRQEGHGEHSGPPWSSLCSIRALGAAAPKGARQAATPHPPLDENKFSRPSLDPPSELTALHAEYVLIIRSESPRGTLINVSIINLTKWKIMDVEQKCNSALVCVSRQT